MTSEELFEKRIRQLVAQERQDGAMILPGKAVNVTDVQCNVMIIAAEGLTLTEVRYTATTGNEEGFRLVPEEGANVLVGFVGEDLNSPVLLRADKIAKVLLKAGGMEICVDDKGKLKAANGQADLKAILNDIITMVKTLTVGTNMGPSNAPLPPTMKKAATLESDIQKLFK